MFFLRSSRASFFLNISSQERSGIGELVPFPDAPTFSVSLLACFLEVVYLHEYNFFGIPSHLLRYARGGCYSCPSLKCDRPGFVVGFTRPTPTRLAAFPASGFVFNSPRGTQGFNLPSWGLCFSVVLRHQRFFSLHSPCRSPPCSFFPLGEPPGHKGREQLPLKRMVLLRFIAMCFFFFYRDPVSPSVF